MKPKFIIKKSWFGPAQNVTQLLNPPDAAAVAQASGVVQSSAVQNEPAGARPGSYQPNYSKHKARKQARAGYGTEGSWQREVNRMFRESKDGARPAPHVLTIPDVTRDLGLLDTTEQKIQKVVRDTDASFGQASQLRVPRLAHARKRLMEVLRADREIGADVRQEIARRAMVWWRNNVVTDMAGTSPKIRISKSQARSRTLIKASKPFPPKRGEDEDDAETHSAEVKGKPPPRGAKGAKDQNVPAGGDRPIKPGMDVGAQEGDKGISAKEMINGKKEKPKKPRPQLSGTSHEAYEEEGEEDEFGNKDKTKGQRIDFGNGVCAEIPEHADYHHHVTEHAKHAQMYHVFKEQDPQRAEAHRHAANLHAKIGNALHAAGETEKNHGRPDPQEMQGNDPLGSFADPYSANGVEGGDQEAPQGPPGAQGGAGVPPGAQNAPGASVDAAGRPMPGAPDGQRNPPGRDSQIEARRAAAQGVKLKGPPSKPTKGGDDDKKGGKPFGKSQFYMKRLHRTGVPFSFLLED